jgi:hypothetical protein
MVRKLVVVVASAADAGLDEEYPNVPVSSPDHLEN